MSSDTRAPEVESGHTPYSVLPDDGAPARPLRRVLILLAIGGLAVAALIAWITVSRLNDIPRVEFDQTSAREALETVSDEDLADIQDDVFEFEEEVIAQEKADQLEAIDDGDLLAGARERLSDTEIDASFLGPYASGEPVADSLHDTYLLLGTDLSGLRADVIILVMLPRDDSVPVMASLPRDLYLNNPCTQRNSRINAALFGCGDLVNGPELVALMVEDYTGVPVDHFAIVDFDGFTSVIDAFGGLEICVDNPVRDPKAELFLEAGCTQADGEIVLQWVRSRATKELVNGTWRTMEGVDDFARQQRQQDVLIDIANKLGSFSSITSLTAVAGGLVDSVTFDDGMDLTNLVQTAWNLRDIDLASIDRVQPGFENYITQSGAFVVVPTESFTDAFNAATVKVDTTEAS